MSKKNRTTKSTPAHKRSVVTLPDNEMDESQSDSAASRILRSARLTWPEMELLQLCELGIDPSECSVEQHRMLQELKSRDFVKLVEYPRLFSGPRWVLGDFGELLMKMPSIRAVAAKRAEIAELVQIIKANPHLYEWDEANQTVAWKGNTEQAPSPSKDSTLRCRTLRRSGPSTGRRP
jgi:hypothetical protein